MSCMKWVLKLSLPSNIISGSNWENLKHIYFQLLFGCPTANFGPLSRWQPHSPDANHSILQNQPEGHQKPCNEVRSLSLAKHLVGFEPGTFWFWLQRLNPLGHSLQILSFNPIYMYAYIKECLLYIYIYIYIYIMTIIFETMKKEDNTNTSSFKT